MGHTRLVCRRSTEYRPLTVVATVTGIWFFLAIHRKSPRVAVRSFPVFFLTALLFADTLARSTWLALRNGGIRWRETLYPLDQLRSQRRL